MDDPDKMQERLDEVEKDIDKAREDAGEADAPEEGLLGYFEGGKTDGPVEEGGP